VLIGAIDEASMALPPEVLATAMRTHQKYFSCLNPDGTAAPRFLFVANNQTADHGRTIVTGNERVLRARLADARFFWEQDRKIRLEDRIDALKERVYHAKLGTVFDKARRMELLSDFLVAHVPGADAEMARRAVFLAKADLSTAMVGEFPELQGVMGRYYALNDGEDPRVAQAIAEHYKPLGPGDSCPIVPDSIVAALADKLDSLAVFFAIGEKPTGSRDPFALRRAAQGLIRLILENRLRLPLAAAFARAANVLELERPDVVGELLEFVADRLKVHLRGEGFVYIGEVKLSRLHHDLIAAVFALAEDDLVRLLARASELAGFLATEDGANLLVAYRRASNIVAIEERRDGRNFNGSIDPSHFAQPEETALYQRLSGMSVTLEAFLREEHFDRAMGRLATLRRPVDEFFERVTVNTDDAALRENRLRLLSRIRAVMNQVADFSQIEG
jgi:glycyl-tRNA synthetase beta chain